MKLCKDCKHIVRGPETGEHLDYPKCGHPAVQNPVDGSPRFTCSQLRNTSIYAVNVAGCDGEEINNPFGGGKTKVED